MNRGLKTLLFIGILILIIISGAKYMFFPSRWPGGDWGQVSYQGYVLYDFCSYKLPESYKFSDYREGKHKRLLIYNNPATDQIFLISILSEFPKVDFGDIRTSSDKAKMSFYRNELYPVNDYLKLMYILPFFRDDSFKGTSKGLTIKGFQQKASEDIETSQTNIKYFEGSFEDILGFYKPNEGFKKYPVPAFKFKTPHKGAIAIIKNKNTGHTLISIGVVPSYGDFNSEEYKTILKSVTFETKPWKDPLGLRKAAGR